ncbi:MAG: 1-acyl-sn-glycerol-3-phosphate acyltransferase [Alphaproteobacteria bacterium]|nr:1-acyl-sn-glycerol-3-phosphate acyltransferase [Alphaproteobacteria bacterium]
MTLLRSLLYQIYFWIVSVGMNLAWTPSLLMKRSAVVRGMEIWVALCFWGLKHIAGLDYEVRGRENIVKGPAIYAMKHLCMWETMAAQRLLHDCALIMKRELTYIPWYGWYSVKSRQIIVDRGGHAKTMRSMLRSAKERVAEGRPIIIFPEGTRKPLGAAPDYKPGVAGMYATLDVPCVPVALNSGLYWPRRGFIRKPGKIIIEFLPAIPPGLKRDAFMAELEKRIETATDHLLREGGWTGVTMKPALA